MLRVGRCSGLKYQGCRFKTTEGKEINLTRKITDLEQEHRDLDAAIGRLEEGSYVDQLQLRRLKKKRLQLKDAIERLKSSQLPDEPA